MIIDKRDEERKPEETKASVGPEPSLAESTTSGATWSDRVDLLVSEQRAEIDFYRTLTEQYEKYTDEKIYSPLATTRESVANTDMISEDFIKNKTPTPYEVDRPANYARMLDIFGFLGKTPRTDELSKEIEDFWKKIEKNREKFPPGTLIRKAKPKNVDSLIKQRTQKERKKVQEMRSREDTLNTIARFGGQMGSMLGGDPINVIASFLGGPVWGQAKNWGTMILREMLIETGVEAAIQYNVQEYRGEQGLPHGPGRAAANIASAPIFTGILGTGIKGASIPAKAAIDSIPNNIYDSRSMREIISKKGVVGQKVDDVEKTITKNTGRIGPPNRKPPDPPGTKTAEPTGKIEDTTEGPSQKIITRENGYKTKPVVFTEKISSGDEIIVRRWGPDGEDKEIEIDGKVVDTEIRKPDEDSMEGVQKDKIVHIKEDDGDVKGVPLNDKKLDQDSIEVRRKIEKIDDGEDLAREKIRKDLIEGSGITAEKVKELPSKEGTSYKKPIPNKEDFNPEQRAGYYATQVIDEIRESNPYDADKSGLLHKGETRHAKNVNEAINSLKNNEKVDIQDNPNPGVETTRKMVEGRVGRFLKVGGLQRQHARLRPDVFQFKSQADEQGVTGTLEEEDEWYNLTDRLILFKPEEGSELYDPDVPYIIADGHQRFNMIKRLLDEGLEKEIFFDAFVFREADGHTVEDVKKYAAAKNFRDGHANPVDAARILDHDQDFIKSLPQRSALRRDAKRLAKLHSKARDKIVREEIPANHAAMVGRIADNFDLEEQKALLDVIQEHEPKTIAEAKTMVDQAKLGFKKTEQETLFGKQEDVNTLIKERSKVAAAAKKRLKKDKATFNKLVRQKGKIEETGENVVDVESNKEVVQNVDEYIKIIDTQQNKKGPISDALTKSAEHYEETGNLSESVDSFIEAINKENRKGNLVGKADEQTGRRGDIDEGAKQQGGQKGTEEGQSGKKKTEEGTGTDEGVEEQTEGEQTRGDEPRTDEPRTDKPEQPIDSQSKLLKQEQDEAVRRIHEESENMEEGNEKIKSRLEEQLQKAEEIEGSEQDLDTQKLIRLLKDLEDVEDVGEVKLSMDAEGNEEKSIREILDELDEDEKFIKQVKDCL